MKSDAQLHQDAMDELNWVPCINANAIESS